MKSNINLALGLPKLATFKLRAPLLLCILIAYIVILLIVWCMTWSFGFYQEIGLHKITSQQEAAEKQLASLAQKYLLSAKLNERDKYLKTLLEQKRQHYSYYFHNLAIHTPQGVWLNAIEVGNGGAFVKLAGKTFNSPLTMVLLQNLRSASAFADKQFKIFDLSVAVPKDASEQKLASFTVQTE